MISTRCCTHLCSDVRIEGDFHFLHRGTWNCGERENGDDTKSFYQMFQSLPPEMKLHVLSFCQFHVLAHDALWLRDEDPSYLPRLIATDPHFTSRGDERCLRSPAYTVATGHVRVDVSSVVHYDMMKRWRELPELKKEEREELSKLFGKANRYVSPYYRRCEHHDMGKPPDRAVDGPQDVLKRLARARGVELVEEVQPFLHRAPISQSPTSMPEQRPPHNALLLTTNVFPLHESDIVLKPGTYHFEYVDHAWEGLVAECDGRSNHFLLDPSDQAHCGVGRRIPRLMCMTLVFRRVLHPRDEVGDTYTTVKQFQGVEDTHHHYVTSNTRYGKRLLVTFSEADEARGPELQWNAAEEEEEGAEHSSMSDDTDSDTGCPYTLEPRELKMNGFEQLLVFQHVLSPPAYVEVYRFSSGTEDRTSFDVEFASSVQLFNIEQNKSGLRINFFVDVEDMRLDQKAWYVYAMLQLVHGSDSTLYAFTAQCDVLPLLVHEDDRDSDVEKVFELVFLN